MALKKYCVIALLVIMAMVLPVGSQVTLAAEGSATLQSGEIESGGLNRTYEYYIPTSYDPEGDPVPLLFSFHGLGSNGPDQEKLTSFAELAEQEGFIAVFPDATELPMDPENPCYENVELVGLPGSNIQWNIGLNWSLQYCAGVDDVGFASDMVDWFENHYNIDESRIYTTGMSNGAMFSHYLALMLPGTFAGIAPVCAPLTTNMTWEDVTPVTVIMMMAPDDPIVPYDGDPIASIYSMDDTVDFWLDVDGIPLATVPVETVWGPTEEDPTIVTRYVYSGGTNGTQVILFKVEGCKTENYEEYCAGHTWPGSYDYAPAGFIGLVSYQIDGSALIWKHLPPVQYYLRIQSSADGSVTAPGEGAFFYDPDISPTEVTLEATPRGTAYKFTGWTGDVDTIDAPGATTTTITIYPNTDYEITANFEPVSSGDGCFIATAAYGTSTAEQLDVLREFRDDVLLKSTVGSQLVDLYYQVSPPVADFISANSFVRTLVRELLIDPIVWVVEATGNIWRN